jgi:peptide/nickel transport system substrate-binding protein
MLVPNPRNEFMKQAMFRIGLLRTINREEIIRDMLCRGSEIDGTLMIDSPFPVGTSDNDQIAYAVDPSIRPGVSNYLLGQLLVNGEKRRQEEALVRKGANEADVPLPELVLVHPKNEIASITCNAIASQWRQIGLRTTLRELEPGQTRPSGDDYDFIYLEVACTEPLADADFLFGSQGAVKHVNATVEQIVRRVNTSSSWRQTSSSLRQLHRQVLNSVAILPLFQIREHYAYRTSVRGVGRDLIFLYQQVDRWSIGRPEGNQP